MIHGILLAWMIIAIVCTLIAFIAWIGDGLDDGMALRIFLIGLFAPLSVVLFICLGIRAAHPLLLQRASLVTDG